MKKAIKTVENSDTANETNIDTLIEKLKKERAERALKIDPKLEAQIKKEVLETLGLDSYLEELYLFRNSTYNFIEDNEKRIIGLIDKISKGEIDSVYILKYPIESFSFTLRGLLGMCSDLLDDIKCDLDFVKDEVKTNEQ